MFTKYSRRLKVLGILGFCFLFASAGLIGCYPRNPEKAEQKVRSADPNAIRKLDAPGLNQLITLRLDKGNLPVGEIFEATGIIEAVTIYDKSEHDKEVRIYVQVRVPEYAGAKVFFRFAEGHRNTVQALKVGQAITLRGELEDDSVLTGRAEINLTGAVIVS